MGAGAAVGVDFGSFDGELSKSRGAGLAVQTDALVILVSRGDRSKAVAAFHRARLDLSFSKCSGSNREQSATARPQAEAESC